MTPGKNILSELKSLSPYLAGLARQLPYAAPPGYFEQLPGTLLQKAKQPDDPKQELKELSVLLASLPKKSPFSIPDDYFNQVPEELTAGISAIEEAKEVLERLHPLLDASRKINPYRVPDGYFDKLPAILLQKSHSTPGKLIGIGKKWFVFSAAAAIVGIVIFLGWLYRPQAVQPLDNNNLALQFEKEMNKLSDEAIFNFADSTQLIYNGSTANLEDEFNELDIQVLLEEVSDGALQQYLKEQPGKVNLLIN